MAIPVVEMDVFIEDARRCIWHAFSALSNKDYDEVAKSKLKVKNYCYNNFNNVASINNASYSAIIKTAHKNVYEFFINIFTSILRFLSLIMPEDIH